MGEETQGDRAQRIDKLWGNLDIRHRGQIDLKDFKRGLKKIDHPLKNADDLLYDVLKAVDTSGDGRIQYNEFTVFVDHAERELWTLFKTIDRDRDGRLDKDELKAAFSKAGLTVSKSKLDQFFAEIDTNKDGVITFDEWRDFLLFLPAASPSLRSILSYYSATGNLNPEGDVHLNAPIQGLGTALYLFLNHCLLGIKNLFFVSFQTPVATVPIGSHMSPPTPTPLPPPRDKNEEFEDPNLFNLDADMEWLSIPRTVSLWLSYRYCAQVLTVSAPQIGYFIAGGMAGVVSRTATAPFDRLKVYLIAQTTVRDGAVRATKSVAPVKAVRQLMLSLVDATRDLWRAGGVRSLFAGNGLNVIKVMPESAVKFGAYETSKRMFARMEGHDDPKHLLPVSQFLAGGISGMVSQCFVYPLDTLKFRMQCETVKGGLYGNRLIASTAAKMWAEHGLASFFRGLPLGLLGMFPYAAIDLATFEYLKANLVGRKARLRRCHEEDVPLSNFATGVIGAFSGALGASIVYPLNVLRTRLQAQGTIQHKPTYTGILDVTRKTLQSEGFRGLYRGITPNLLKVVPSVSISYIVYENSKRLFDLS